MVSEDWIEEMAEKLSMPRVGVGKENLEGLIRALVGKVKVGDVDRVFEDESQPFGSNVVQFLVIKDMMGGKSNKIPKELIKKEKSDSTEELVEQMNQQQGGATKIIREMSESKDNLYQQQIKGLREQMNRIANTQDSRVSKRLDKLQRQLQKQERKKPTEELKEYADLEKEVKSFAKEEGNMITKERAKEIKKKKREEESVNWDEAIQEGIDTAKEVMKLMGNKKEPRPKNQEEETEPGGEGEGRKFMVAGKE